MELLGLGFGHEIAAARAHYQPLCDTLKDSTLTQKFIKLISKLIKAISSRIPRDALYAKDDCRNKQAILEFLQFFEDWQKLENKIPVSRSTSLGLKVTLRATLEILDMLKNYCSFYFIMHTYLCSIPEIFFGHEIFVWRERSPRSENVCTGYRLASSFSLIRPPRGCNISGKDLLKSLVEAKEVLISSNKVTKDLWFQSIDDMLESTEPIIKGSSTNGDHDYNKAVTSDAVQSYIAGYIVRKLKKIIKCGNCLQVIQMIPEAGKELLRNDVICKMELFGVNILQTLTQFLRYL
ncbi:hypothetical protein KQX54_003564 [Cotesia glomerata]|uniref:Uncharacterized protein n=1 Tax=Cotesia glomerata TaxID=32391 RepID=A0AAV7J1E7_COTGL|nr:hypothetical protein KQX54_003564 [Cotesia glomerata]